MIFRWDGSKVVLWYLDSIGVRWSRDILMRWDWKGLQCLVLVLLFCQYICTCLWLSFEYFLFKLGQYCVNFKLIIEVTVQECANYLITKKKSTQTKCNLFLLYFIVNFDYLILSKFPKSEDDVMKKPCSEPLFTTQPPQN